MNPFNPNRKRKSTRSTRRLIAKNLILTLNIRNYSLRYKTVLLSPPALAFLQIQNKDNDDIVLLAPPRPWRRRKCFAVAAAIIICSKGSMPVVNGKRTSGEGASSSCTPFAALLVTNCVICRRGRALSTLAAAEALCSVGPHSHSSQWVKACGEW